MIRVNNMCVRRKSQSLILFFSALAIISLGSFVKAERKIVVDHRGKQVTLKKHVKRIATFPIPHPHIIVAVDGSAEKIVGTHPMTKSAARVSILGKIAPALMNANTGYLNGFNLNVEELVKISPDVFFTDKVLRGIENLEKTGVPVVRLGLLKEEVPYLGSRVAVFSPKTTMRNWLRITSDVLGKESGVANRIVDEWELIEREIAEKLRKISLNKRPRVLIMFKTKPMMIGSYGTFGHYWIARTGGINVADNLKGKHPAMAKAGSFEEIMQWNPDIVYLSNFESTMPKDLYENRIQGQDWSVIKAVKNRKVYRLPLGIYRWYPPNLDGPLMLKWMAQKNYPGYFAWDLKQEIKTHFTQYYGYTPSDYEVASILTPLSSGNL